MKTSNHKQKPVSKPITWLDSRFRARRHAPYTLNVTLLYEDALTRQWAVDAYERMMKMTGVDGLRATWWRLHDLSQAGVLAGAVSTAMRADMVVVAIRAAEGLPLPFYVWVEQWLPHRLLPAGALAALLPAPTGSESRPARVADYLRAAAHQGRLDFLIKEHKLPVKAARPAPRAVRHDWSESIISFSR